MKKQTEKQALASHRNWFKFKLAGMYFPFQKEALTDDENEKWNKIQQLRRELLESFRENSVKKGLKVQDVLVLKMQNIQIQTNIGLIPNGL